MSRDQHYLWMRTTENEEAAYLVELLGRTIAARKSRGWSQRFVAKALGVPLERYKKYEQRSPMPLYLVERFCTLTGMDVYFFITGGRGAPLPGRDIAGGQKQLPRNRVTSH
jgi:transcriptional regulator with XRE-family HTH domain